MLPPSSSLMQVPPLGPHFRIAWLQEDEKEFRDINSDYGSTRASARHATRQTKEKEDRVAKVRLFYLLCSLCFRQGTADCLFPSFSSDFSSHLFRRRSSMMSLTSATSRRAL